MLPDFSKEMHYETEIVVKINRLGRIFQSALLTDIMMRSPLE